MINALLDALHENVDRLRYLTERIDSMGYAFGEDYVDGNAYSGHVVDDVLFAPE